jgi:integrase/recombinase XerD
VRFSADGGIDSSLISSVLLGDCGGLLSRLVTVVAGRGPVFVGGNYRMEFSRHRQPPEEWVTSLDAWISELRFRGCTPATLQAWWYKVSSLARRTRSGPLEISTEEIVSWINRGVDDNARRSDLNAVRSYFSYMSRHSLRMDNPVEGIPLVRRDKRKQLPASNEAVNKGLSHQDARVRLMVRLMNDAGLRRTEVATASTHDVYDDLIGKSIMVHGKGRKDRLIPLTNDLAQEIGRMPEGWLFPGEAGGHICSDTVYRLVRNATGCPPHAFRRKFATDIWKATGDLLKLQELLGHESLATTQYYVMTTHEDLREAVNGMSNYRRHATTGSRLDPEKLLKALGVPEILIPGVITTIRA